MALTEAQIKEYLEKVGQHCPYCNSENLLVGDNQFDGTTGWEAIECEDCHKRWIDQYTLTGITEDMDGS